MIIKTRKNKEKHFQLVSSEVCKKLYLPIMSFPLSLRSSPNPGNTLPPLSPLTITRRSSLSSPSSLYFLHPFLQEGLSILTSISTIMSHIPTSLLNLLGLSKTPASSSSQNMTNMMRELVMDQQRTMFYTVTMSPTQQKTKDMKRTITPSLKVGYVMNNQV